MIYILRGSLPEVVRKAMDPIKNCMYIFFNFRRPECDGWGYEGGELEAGYVFGGLRNLLRAAWGSFPLVSGRSGQERRRVGATSAVRGL